MQTRRFLITAPITALLGTALVAGVIATGQRTLARAVDAPRSADARPGVTAELARFDAALDAATACVGPVECDATHAAARVEAAMDGIARWPSDSRYVHARSRLHDELEARHDLLRQLVLARADGRVTRAEREHVDELRADTADAANATIRAQHDAGLLDDAAVERALTELRDGLR
jgi:hypothetical protein